MPVEHERPLHKKSRKQINDTKFILLEEKENTINGTGILFEILVIRVPGAA